MEKEIASARRLLPVAMLEHYKRKKNVLKLTEIFLPGGFLFMVIHEGRGPPLQKLGLF